MTASRKDSSPDRLAASINLALTLLRDGFTPEQLAQAAREAADGDATDKAIAPFIAEMADIMDRLAWPEEREEIAEHFAGLEAELIARLMAEDLISEGRTAAHVREVAGRHPEAAPLLIRAADIMEQPISPGLDPERNVNG